jgi:hypothetical protein
MHTTRRTCQSPRQTPTGNRQRYLRSGGSAGTWAKCQLRCGIMPHKPCHVVRRAPSHTLPRRMFACSGDARIGFLTPAQQRKRRRLPASHPLPYHNCSLAHHPATASPAASATIVVVFPFVTAGPKHYPSTSIRLLSPASPTRQKPNASANANANANQRHDIVCAPHRTGTERPEKESLRHRVRLNLQLWCGRRVERRECR